MTAEKEAYEVARVEEKSGLDVGYCQDVLKSDCNGIGGDDKRSDPENSYVFVAKADGLSDGSVDDNDGVVVDVSTVQLRSVAPAQVLGVDSYIGNGDVNKPLKEEENEAMEGSPLVVNDVTAEKECSLVDVKVVEDTVEGVGSDDEKGNLDVADGGVSKPLKEQENGHVEGTVGNPRGVNGIKLNQESFLDDADGIKDTIVETNCLGETVVKPVEDRNGKIEKSEVFVIEKLNDKNNRIEVAVEDDLPIEDPTGKMESSELIGMEKINNQNKRNEITAEDKLPFEDPTEKMESSEVVGVEKVYNQNEKVAETEPVEADDQSILEPSPGLQEKKDSLIPKLGLAAESGEGEELRDRLPLNESLKTRGVCKDEVNLGSTEVPELVVEDALQSKLQEVKEEDTKIELASESVEPEVFLTTSMNSDLDVQHTEDQEAVDNHKCDSIPQNNFKLDLDEEKILENDTYSNAETTCDEGKNIGFSVSHVEHHLLHPEVADVTTNIDEDSCEIMNSPVISQINVDSGAEVDEPLIEVMDHDTETVIVSFSCTDGRTSEIVEQGAIGHDKLEKPTENSTNLGSDCSCEISVCTEKLPDFRSDHVIIGTEVSGVNSEDDDCSHVSTDIKSETEIHKNTDNITGVHASSMTEVSDSFVPDDEGAANIILESADIEGVGDQLDGSMRSSAETSLSPKNDVSENSQKNHILKTSLEIGEDMNVVAATKPFNFLVRVPRFNDENLKEQIKKAKIEVDEKTKLRDAIQSQVQEKRANNQVHGVDCECAKGEDRSIRKLVKLKRMEIESLQSVINKAKNAISIEDMDNRINSMEHMIQHETLPLREEKQLIREIKQLNQLREQLSSNIGKQTEVQQALEQRHEAEERLKILKKELGDLKDRVSKAQTAAVEAESKYDGENKKVRELQDQFKAADVVRQEAYAKLQILRKQLSEKYKYFIKYRDDEGAAKNCAFTRNGEALYHLCMEQVENFMELWNKNDEFRNEYVRFNTRSTVRRFGTLDGRSLGPDEKPYILPNHVVNKRNERKATISRSVDSVSQSPTLDPKQPENLKNDDQPKKVEEYKDQKVTKKELPRSKKGNSLAFVSDWDVPEEVPKKDPMKTREEIELMRKEEEIRMEEAELKRKEEVRLEQLAKANEAREKKRRHDEKVQLREELRARKEAELKEKEREKKLRKKERKKAASSPNVNSENLENTIETVKEEDVQVKDIPTPAPSKKPTKPSLVRNQTKTKSIPPPFRNRNKKKWQHWMWVIIAALVIFVFYLGNMGLPTFSNLKR